MHKLPLVIALYSLAFVGCSTPAVIKEPYPVEVVREVVIPIPDEYTRELPTPKLPEVKLTGQDLVNHILEWKAWGKVVLEHRAKVEQLSKGKDSLEAEGVIR
jgi:hypothetical protein